MTLDHPIDVEPATTGSAAIALKDDRPAIVRKFLSLSRFVDRAGSTTATRYTSATQLSDALWCKTVADSDRAVGSSRLKTAMRGGHMSVVTTQPEMLAADHACTQAADAVAKG